LANPKSQTLNSRKPGLDPPPRGCTYPSKPQPFAGAVKGTRFSSISRIRFPKTGSLRAGPSPLGNWRESAGCCAPLFFRSRQHSHDRAILAGIKARLLRPLNFWLSPNRYKQQVCCAGMYIGAQSALLARFRWLHHHTGGLDCDGRYAECRFGSQTEPRGLSRLASCLGWRTRTRNWKLETRN
jgi:hypothetical protein